MQSQVERKKHPPIKNYGPVYILFFRVFRRKTHEKRDVNVKISSTNEKIKNFWILIILKIIKCKPLLGAYFEVREKSKKNTFFAFFVIFFNSFQGKLRSFPKMKMYFWHRSERQIDVFDLEMHYFSLIRFNYTTFNCAIF